jgi:hypothetical protein
VYHRTNIDTQLSKNKQPVPCRPTPVTNDGLGRTGRTKPTAREWPSSAFFEVVLLLESVYNQKKFADPGHRVTERLYKKIKKIIMKTNNLNLKHKKEKKLDLLDIIIDGKPLVEYFIGRLGAHPNNVSPFGWASASPKYNEKIIKKYLFEIPADIAPNRNYILVCPDCGDEYCGAFSVAIRKDGDFVYWEDWAWVDITPDEDPNISLRRDGWCAKVPVFCFKWEEYKQELEKNKPV